MCIRDRDDVNEEISIQNEEIVRQERLLIKLKAKQDAIPKGSYYAGRAKLNDKIRKTSELINLEKNTLKELTNKQKEATTEVKKSTVAKKEGSKQSKESIADFKVMGVSLNGVKKGFQQVIPTAKAMFGTIKAGIMSTGIGALVLAVVALTQSFKRSEAGQEKFQRIMAGIGAVTSQVADAFSDLGGIIIDTFQDPMPALKSFGNGLLKFLRDPTGATRDMFVKATLSVTEFVDETKKEVDALVEVTKARQKAHHIDRELKVERAKANREINDIRLQAEDRENKNATERIALLRRAQAIEESITAKEIESKNILIEALKLEMKQGHNSIEIKDKLAQLQADLINLDTKKLRSQRLLQTQITTAVREEAALKEQAAKDAQKLIDDEWKAKIKANDEWNKEQQKQAKAEMALAKKVAKEKKRLDKIVEQEKERAINTTFQVAQGLAAEDDDLAKGVAVAKTIYNTQQSIMKAMAEVPYPWNLVQSVANGLMGAKAVQTILSTSPDSSGDSGGSLATGSAGSAAQTPAPQMMSGAFELTGGQEIEPTRAYVVSDDITASQNGLEVIRRRATI